MAAVRGAAVGAAATAIALIRGMSTTALAAAAIIVSNLSTAAMAAAAPPSKQSAVTAAASLLSAAIADGSAATAAATMANVATAAATISITMAGQRGAGATQHNQTGDRDKHRDGKKHRTIHSQVLQYTVANFRGYETTAAASESSLDTDGASK